MLRKNLISDFRALHHSRNRMAEKEFLAEGEKVVTELLRSEYSTLLVAALPSFLEKNHELLSGVEAVEISPKELERISTLQTPNQVVAIVSMPGDSESWKNVKDSPVLMLDGISDPGNMGTMIRTAEWFGIRNIICSPHSVSCYNPKVVQGSMGSLFRMNVSYVEPENAITSFRDRGYKIISASLKGDPVAEIKPGREFVLVIGSESHGISPYITELSDHQVSIRQYAGSETESLNASVACGIILFAFSQSA